MDSLAVISFITILIIIIAGVLINILKSPFHYPYFTYTFDVSGKRKPQIEDLIDDFFINGNFPKIEDHEKNIQQWKNFCTEKIEHSLLKSRRMKQYQECLDDKSAFQFIVARQQTRYRQKNYVREAYKVTQSIGEFSFDYEYLKRRNNQLKAINYECTLRKYHSNSQRKNMTKELRNKVIIRDNYTCQSCGKYMPDEVGLQVDHIVPVSKGGKTVLSNLQVLCSKCNGKKSDKI